MRTVFLLKPTQAGQNPKQKFIKIRLKFLLNFIKKLAKNSAIFLFLQPTLHTWRNW